MLMSRFLAKVAVECLALKFVDLDGGIASIVSEHALDPVRDYARKGGNKHVWPFHARTLYPPDFVFREPEEESYEVLHEWIFTALDREDIYFVLALFGVEYALNLGEMEIESYRVWLAANRNRSPLYMDGIQNS
jgi:hypothetical protein